MRTGRGREGRRELQIREVNQVKGVFVSASERPQRRGRAQRPGELTCLNERDREL